MMTPEHERWNDFRAVLEEHVIFEPCGPNGRCRVTGCDGYGIYRHAIRILRRMGFTNDAVEASCQFFRDHFGFCDCEILMNVENNVELRAEPEGKP